jgi:hypothetical protein
MWARCSTSTLASGSFSCLPPEMQPSSTWWSSMTDCSGDPNALLATSVMIRNLALISAP